ncbi:MAG: ABC transporter substrate-binding protein [Dehalococcoidales bacterium]
MRKWLAIPFVLLLAVVMILGSCSTAEKTTAPPTQPPTSSNPNPSSTVPAKVAPSGTIRYAMTDFSYESTDPIYYESFWGWSMYDSLISTDKDGNYIGDVAESWSISPDGNTWTFKIRHGINFWDGTPLTAADVKFSVDRFGSDESTNPWSYYLNPKYNKVSSTVVDDYTFQYVTAHPEPALEIPFAWTRILPMAYYNKLGEAGFRATPMGSGPWKFVEHIQKTSFTMEANTNYWGQVPYFQYFKQILVPEESTQVAMLERNEVDLVTVNMDRLVALQKAGWKTMELGYPNLWNINFQGTWLAKAGPTHDIRIRQAMSFAINRQQIVDTYFHGNGDATLGQWFIQPGGYGWTDALKNDPFDLAKAKDLLQQANYPAAYTDPTIHIYTTAASLDMTQLLQAYWKDAGIQVKIEVVDSMVNGTYFFNFQRLTGNETNVGWIFQWYYGTVANSIYHCSNMYCSWGAHNTSNDPTADAMYKDATSELDTAKALQKWAAFRVYARSLYVDVGICGVKPLMIVGPSLGDFTGKNWLGIADCANGIKHAGQQ